MSGRNQEACPSLILRAITRARYLLRLVRSLKAYLGCLVGVPAGRKVDGMDSVKENPQEGGRAESDTPVSTNEDTRPKMSTDVQGCPEVSTFEDNSALVEKRRRGRPPGAPNRSTVTAQAVEAASSPVEAIRVRQVADCEGLAGLAEKIRKMIARGEGMGRDGNAAAALGSLTRATQTLHQMEAEAYGLAGDGAGGRDKVIILPVPVGSMEEWQALASGLLGARAPEAAPPERSGAWRAVEPDPEPEQ